MSGVSDNIIPHQANEKHEFQIAVMPDYPIYLGDLPQELQAEFLVRHLRAFHHLWLEFGLDAMLEELYQLDLRELIDTSGPVC